MKTNRIATIGLFAALTAVFSQLAVPLPFFGVPVTLQTFAVALCGYVLGKKDGLISIAVYLAVGACGAPVFASFGSGFQKLVGVSGGFLWGFLPFVYLCGLCSENKKGVVPLSLLALLICHAFGVVQFAFVSNIGVFKSFISVSFPFILKDIISLVLAYLLTKRLKGIKI